MNIIKSLPKTITRHFFWRTSTKKVVTQPEKIPTVESLGALPVAQSNTKAIQSIRKYQVEFENFIFYKNFTNNFELFILNFFNSGKFYRESNTRFHSTE